MPGPDGEDPSRPEGSSGQSLEVVDEKASGGEAADEVAVPGGDVGPPEGSGEPPDDEGAKPPARPHARRRKILMRTGIGLVLLVLLLVGAGYGYITYRNHQIQHVNVPGESSVDKTGVEDILLVGSTSRCALDNKQSGAFGSCSQGVTGVNSDVIMVLRLDPVHHRVSLLSFPRDTFLPNARPGQSNRIDSALAYGPAQLVRVVEEDFGIPINHYVELNFDSFQEVVKALGGLKMYFPYPVKDADSGLNITHRGCQVLGKFATLAVVRARHMYYKVHGKWLYDGSGDLGRIIRDHEFLRVLASAVIKRGIGNPFTDNALLGAVAPNLTVDNGFSLQHMVSLTLTYRGVDPEKVPQRTIPVLVDTSFAYQYKGFNYGSVVFPTEPQDSRAIRAFMGSPNAGAKLRPSSIRLAVEGGMADPAGTAATARELSALGYRVVRTSEVPPVGPVAETQVLYAPGHLAEGQRVLASLAGAVALGKASGSQGADVTVVTGSHFSVRSGAPVGKGVGQSGSTVRTTSMALGDTSISLMSFETSPLTSPTSANAALPYYDPRGCPPPRHKG